MRLSLVAALILNFAGCLVAVPSTFASSTVANLPEFTPTSPNPYFYSDSAVESLVSFDHVYVTDIRDLAQIERMTATDQRQFLNMTIRPTLKFIYGPLTRRELAGPQSDEFVVMDWQKAYLRNGFVAIPLHYKAHWLVNKSVAFAGHVQIPIPLNYEQLFTEKWKRCTDSQPAHQTHSFYWYFWDPTRYGCDHSKGVQYEEVDVQFGITTMAEKLSFPEYDRMLQSRSGDADLSMTIAFGYVEDPANPKPESDSDYGASEYRDFVKYVKRTYPYLTSRPIQIREYQNYSSSDRVIGYEFTGTKGETAIRLNVVIAAGVDQMYLFAKSFAHDHDDVFAWMGHSRVGSGFDADNFRSIVMGNPIYYSISDQYQVIYWGGCNSYSYYTLPFFEIKAKAFPNQDPKGTKNLDIVAHGLPSLFSLNVGNASVFTAAFMNMETHTSYQTMIQKLERQGERAGIPLMAVVLGDEDNSSQ